MNIALTVDPNLSSKLDDISEHYRAAGVCSGEDCRRLMIEVSLRPITMTLFVLILTTHTPAKGRLTCLGPPFAYEYNSRQKWRRAACRLNWNLFPVN